FVFFFFFSSRRRHTRSYGDWSSDVCSSDLRSPALASIRGTPRSLRTALESSTARVSETLATKSPGATRADLVSSGPPQPPIPPSSTAWARWPKYPSRNHRRAATDAPASSYTTTLVDPLTPALRISDWNCSAVGIGCRPPPSFPV